MSVSLTLGTNPVLSCTVATVATINSSNTVTLTCKYTLAALSSPSYWGYGVCLQTATRKYDSSAGAWGSWSSWSTQQIIAENTNTWSTKTGTITKTVSGCTSSTNVQIRYRLVDVGADAKIGTAVSEGWDIVSLTVAKGANIAGVSKLPNKTYHIVGETITVSCELAAATGYQISFNKWTSNNTTATPNSTNPTYTFNVSDAETVTLTASANKLANSGTVYYYPNGGVVADGKALQTSGTYVGASTATNAFDYEDTAINLYNVETLFKRTGYHTHSDAKAWILGSPTGTTYLNQAQANMSSHVASKTGVVLKAYANWVANTYTIQYNANGGSGTMSNTTCTYDKSINLTTNSFTREGYDFLGWSTTSTGSVVYQDGASIKNLTTINNDVITLYAVWKAHSGKVYYHPNGGVAVAAHPLLTSGDYAGFSSATSDVTYESTFYNLKDVTELFSRTGYKIAYNNAWRYGSPTATTYFNQSSQNFSSYLKSATDAVFKLYANWTPITYKIVYNPNFEGWENTETSFMMPTTATYDKSIKLATNVITRAGYKFVGWSTTTDGGVIYGDGDSVKNLTTVDGGVVNLYAVWEVDNVCYYGVQSADGKVTYEPVLVHYCPDGISYQPCLMYMCDEVTEGWKRTGI